MHNKSYNFPTLSKSFKSKLPFRLSVPSFIYPADYLPNVCLLKPYVDEIELLLFESRHPQSLPSKEVIKQLQAIAGDSNLTYNVHLPTDISLGALDKTERQRSVDTIKKVLDLVRPLRPTTHTLHLPLDASLDAKSWKDAVHSSLTTLIQTEIDSRQLSIESLSYPLVRVEDLISTFDLSVCMDMGHLFLHEFDIDMFYHQFSDRISIVHLHGVFNGKDHLSLDKLSSTQTKQAINILKRLNKTVSVEVFTYERLERSLSVLSRHFD